MDSTWPGSRCFLETSSALERLSAPMFGPEHKPWLPQLRLQSKSHRQWTLILLMIQRSRRRWTITKSPTQTSRWPMRRRLGPALTVGIARQPPAANERVWPLSEPDRSASYGVIGIKGDTDYPVYEETLSG